YSCYLFFFFFFSSRRRHTRSLRDWSSDVCSSDLYDVLSALNPGLILTRVSDTITPGRTGGRDRVRLPDRGLQRLRDRDGALRARSEERRVGKECRSWGQTVPAKKKMNGVASRRVV